MTIRWVELRNFQRHAKLRIDLDPHVTTLVGPTDVGKSAVLRALRWCFLNEGRVADFVKWDAGGKATKVTVGVGKHVISRVRKGRENYYLLDGRRLNIDRGIYVPDPIASILNVSGVNFQGQLDGPFWFSLPPPEVSRQLNAIINLGSIDEALSKAAQAVRRATTAVEVSEQRLLDARTRKKELSWVVQADKKLSEAERWDGVASDAAARYARLASSLTEYQNRVRVRQKVRESLGVGLIATEAISTFVQVSDQVSRLERVLSQIRELRQRAAKTIPDLGPVKAAQDRLDALVERRRKLEGYWNGIANLEYSQCELDRERGVLERALAKVTTCPTCGQRLSPSQRRTGNSPNGCPPHGPNHRGNGSTSRSGTSGRSTTLHDALAEETGHSQS